MQILHISVRPFITQIHLMENYPVTVMSMSFLLPVGEFLIRSPMLIDHLLIRVYKCSGLYLEKALIVG